MAKEIPVYTDNTGSLRPNWARDTSTSERSYLSGDDRKATLKAAKKTLKIACNHPNDADKQELARKQWIRSEYCLLNRTIL